MHTGFFGMSESFVPLADATVAGDTLNVPFGKQMVKDAPRIDADGQLARRTSRNSTAITAGPMMTQAGTAPMRLWPGNLRNLPDTPSTQTAIPVWPEPRVR